MIRIARSSTRNLGLRLLSQNSKWNKPFDFTNSTSNKPGEPFDLESLLARSNSGEGTSKKSSVLNDSEKNTIHHNRFVNMFEKAQTGNKHVHNNGSEKFKELNQKHNNKKHRNQRSHGDRRNHVDTKKSSRKALRFQICTGSDQAQNALKDLISKVHMVSKSYKVKFVNPQSNKLEQRHLVEIVNDIDLAEKGLFMVAPSKEGDLPLIKTNKVFEMIKQYTDELAAQREKELLEKGSIAAQKAVRQRDRAEKKKSATKILTLSWKISLSDLNNQKKMEIKRRMNKGEKFILYIGDRRSLYSARKSVDKVGGIVENMKEPTGVNEEQKEEIINASDPSEVDFEIRRRHMIIDELQNFLEECECQFDISGHIDSRIMVSCAPLIVKTKLDEGTLEENSSKELKKQKKLMKLKKIEEKKVKKSKDEEDLDSLYQFKIED